MPTHIIELLLYLLNLQEKKVDVKELNRADFEVGDLLGEGGNGYVFSGVWKSKNMRVALKKVKISSKCCDTSIMATLGEHPNIISFYGFAVDFPEKIIVTALAENGSLYDYLHKKGKTPTLEQSLTWAKHVAYGMAYMHRLELVHRDLKSSNVLFMEDMTAQICDFGTSRTMANTTVPSKAAGTYRWMAPEVAKKDVTNKSCDIFSYSIVVWELIEHKLPFHECPTDVMASMCIINNERPPITSPAWPQFLVDLVEVGWSANPRERPTSFDILTSLKNKVFFMS